MALTDLDRAILELERSWWKQPGAKNEAARHATGLGPVAYSAALHALLSKPEALAFDPQLVARLRRIRDGRRRRSVRRDGFAA